MKRVALDGWALVYASSSPQALHLLGLLAHLPAGVQAVALLPGEKPAWLPAEVECLSLTCPNTPWGCLTWEQRQLPLLTRQAKTDYLHTDSLSAPFFTNLSCTLSSSAAPRHHQGLINNLCAALGAGGAARARTREQSLLWPADLESPSATSGLVVCKPFVPAPFHPLNTANEHSGAYVLYHGPGSPPDLHRLAAAWSWAAGSVGSHIPLMAAGLSASERNLLTQIAIDYHVSDSLQVLPGDCPDDLPGLYVGCAALFHPCEISPWGDPVLLALACGKAVVAGDTPATRQRVGPAAYLADLTNPRSLGAALLTVLVEERIAAELGNAAHERFANLTGADVKSALDQLWSQ